jgi:hypothetical protein
MGDGEEESSHSSIADKLIDSQVDILRYLSEQNGRDVSAGMKGYCCGATIGVAELLVRSFLSDFFKTELNQD